MKEQTILQCARCLNHTPQIETDTAESILEAIKKHKHCNHCGHYVMLCFESKPVKENKHATLSWRSANAPAINRQPKRPRNRTTQARHHASTSRVQAMRVKETADPRAMDGARG